MSSLKSNSNDTLYSDEFIEIIMGMGTINYPFSKIVNVVDIPNPEKFKFDFYNPKSVIAKAYQKGIDRADYVLDTKLFELAKDGDLKAYAVYEQRKRQNALREKEDQRSVS